MNRVIPRFCRFWHDLSFDSFMVVKSLLFFIFIKWPIEVFGNGFNQFLKGMKQVRVTIERSLDMFTAYAEKVEGIYGAGHTVEEAQASIEKSIRLYRRYNKGRKHPLREDVHIVYQFDIASILNYYKGIFTHAALERVTGIHQKQLQHYASGLRKPRAAQKQKISKALQALGKELLSINLVP